MKILLVLAVVFAVWWLLRRNARESTEVPPPQADPALPRDIVACTQCGLHLPAEDALPGRGGVFCDPAHRAAYEAAHPLP